jgi:hypothetical protein
MKPVSQTRGESDGKTYTTGLHYFYTGLCFSGTESYICSLYAKKMILSNTEGQKRSNRINYNVFSSVVMSVASAVNDVTP